MYTPGQLWRRLWYLLRRSRLDSELQEEMRQHAALKMQKNLAAGMDPEEARYAAQRQLGNVTRQREESRQNWGFPFLESLLQDVRYGMRGLRNAPGFTLVAVVTLALGVGATTAIFSIVNTVLLRPLPYKDSSRLVYVWSVSPMFPGFQMGQSKPDFDDTRTQTHSFEAIASYQARALSLTGAGEPEQISAAAVSSDFLSLFSVHPEKGRDFQPGDGQLTNGNVALLSHGLWQRRFARDAGIVGKTVMLDQKPYTVAGVLPAGFNFPDGTEAWIPLVIPEKERLNRDSWNYFTLAKLRPSASVSSAQAEMEGLAARLSQAYRRGKGDIHFKVASLQQAAVQGEAKPELMILLAAVGFLLLIASANVSNLILSRGIQRQREIAVRAALGASRRRILRQLLSESLLLALAGGLCGMVLAAAGVDGFRAFAPADFARLNELRVEPLIAVIALAVATLSGVLCGLAPALQTSRCDLNLALKDRSPSAAAPGRFSLRGFLVVSEISLALVLLTGSALMVQSMVRLLKVDTGFRTDHLLTAELGLASARYPSEDAQRLYLQRLLEALHSEPQFNGVAVSNNSLLTSTLALINFDPQLIGVNQQKTNLEAKSVDPGYFQAMGIPRLAGRVFSERDTKGSPQYVVIGESLARRFFSGQDAIGKTLKFGSDSSDQYEVVGVVADTRDVHLASKPRLQVYFPLLQGPSNKLHVMVRSSADPLTLTRLLQERVWSVDKDQPVSKVQTMAEVISQSVAEPRFRTWLLSAFAFTGLALTMIGIYGVISYSVSQRTREMGIRIALGAPPANVRSLVLRQGVRLAILGAAIGAGGSLLLMRLLASQLYEIKPGDPATLLGAALLMLAVALGASYLPARRATRVDPMVALRYE